jgi:hypothetical protein
LEEKPEHLFPANPKLPYYHLLGKKKEGVNVAPSSVIK